MRDIPSNCEKVLKEFNSKFRKTTDLTKPEICSKLVPTNVYKMTDVERELMISKINNKKKNPKLMETFFNLNGINPSEEELDVLQNTIDNGEAINIDESNSLNSENGGGSSKSINSVNLSDISDI
jgi:hypothetical protein